MRDFAKCQAAAPQGSPLASILFNQSEKQGSTSTNEGDPVEYIGTENPYEIAGSLVLLANFQVSMCFPNFSALVAKGTFGAFGVASAILRAETIPRPVEWPRTPP